MLTIISGLPGAGKSALANRLVAETGAVLVGRDSIRNALINLRCEVTVTFVLVEIARVVLLSGCSVVVDSWNLDEVDLVRWCSLARATGSKIEWVHVPTPVEECVRRDALRPDPNGEEAIRATALRYAARLEELSALDRGLRSTEENLYGIR